jgi:DNA polymerase III, delta subunit
MLSEHHAQLLRVLDINSVKPLEYYGDASDVEVETLQFSSIGIDEVRRITLVASLRPELAKFRLLLVITSSVTFEAQQALLKILEEPPQTTKFLFVVPLDFIMLPTLASRFQVIDNFISDEEGKSFGMFIKLSYSERLAEITKRMTKKDSLWTMEIRRGLALYLKQEVCNLPLIKLRTLNMIMEKLGARGSSNKMLLEELALTLPNHT